jgi:hypothetical protein
MTNAGEVVSYNAHFLCFGAFYLALECLVLLLLDIIMLNASSFVLHCHS